MRKITGITWAILLSIGSANLGLAQSNDPISGEWRITRIVFGNPQYHRLTLKLENDKITGAFASGKKVEGALQGSVVHFVSRDSSSTIDCTGNVSGDTLSGKCVETFPTDPKNPQESTITAIRVPPPRSGPAQRHEFTPTIFYREFSDAPPPVLRIWPGDTVHTTTVDAGGVDERGVRRSLGGNPQTGPFYIETAWPGDTLAVHFTRNDRSDFEVSLRIGCRSGNRCSASIR